MIKPTIHLNGTGKNRLRETYLNAYKAVRNAQEALEAVEFNARDYYIQGPNAWPQAEREMTERITAVVKIREDLVNILEAIE